MSKRTNHNLSKAEDDHPLRRFRENDRETGHKLEQALNKIWSLPSNEMHMLAANVTHAELLPSLQREGQT